jgi:hypothetical protein
MAPIHHIKPSREPEPHSLHIKNSNQHSLRATVLSCESTHNFSFEKSSRLCDTLSLVESEDVAGGDLTRNNILHCVYSMRHQRHFCAIELTSPRNQESYCLELETSDAAIGICSRNARIGDIVTVVRDARGRCFEPVAEPYYRLS